MLLTR